MKSKVHFLFAGGAGVSAVAALAQKNGWQVSACEHLNPDSVFFQELKKSGCETYAESSIDHLHGVETLVVSNATAQIEPDNLEVVEAKKKGLRVVLAEEFLADELLKDKFVIAVAGTNGKSTTTAMVGLIMEKAGLDPSVFVGAIVPAWAANYHFGKSQYFVIEADEYSEKFLLYHPNIEVITNIDFDHPDYFSSLEAVQEAFEKFAAKVAEDGVIFLGPNVELQTKINLQKQFERKEFDLRLIGSFNQENASLAFSVADYLKIDPETIKQSLEGFSGIGRRFEFVGEEKEVLVFDDYAHHPTAVAATLKAAREKFPDQRIWCVFQPHTYSRLEKLFAGFVESLNQGADKIVLLPVYASREKQGETSSKDLSEALKNKGASYFDSHDSAATYLAKEAIAGDVIICMGAGDINQLSVLILKKLSNKA